MAPLQCWHTPALLASGATTACRVALTGLKRDEDDDDDVKALSSETLRAVAASFDDDDDGGATCGNTRWEPAL